MYESILPLRCLYQKYYSAKQWTKLEVLQSHCEERKLSGKYDMDRNNMKHFINFFKIDPQDEEQLLKICGIIMVKRNI